MVIMCNCWGYRLRPLGSLPGKILWKALIFKERSSIDLCLRCCNQPISNADQDSTFSNWKQISRLCGGWCYCALLLTGCWLFVCYLSIWGRRVGSEVVRISCQSLPEAFCQYRPGGSPHHCALGASPGVQYSNSTKQKTRSKERHIPWEIWK